PRFVEYLTPLRPDFCVYHAYDLYRATPGWTNEDALQEAALLDRADLIIASSRPIAETLQRETRREIVILPNGADTTLFSSSADTVPPDIRHIPQPRIGYIGNLNRKVDFPLIE